MKLFTNLLINKIQNRVIVLILYKFTVIESNNSCIVDIHWHDACRNQPLPRATPLHCRQGQALQRQAAGSVAGAHLRRRQPELRQYAAPSLQPVYCYQVTIHNLNKGKINKIIK